MRARRVGPQALLALGLALAGCNAGEERARVDDPHPLLQPGARIDVDGGAYIDARPARGELVSFYGPGSRSDVWVFRVVALPGELVALQGDALAVNGQVVRSPAGLPVPPAASSVLATPASGWPMLVPAGRYFVVGDNPEGAGASRYWGTLRLDTITGRVTPGP